MKGTLEGMRCSGRIKLLSLGAAVLMIAGTVNAAVVYQINCGSTSAVSPYTADQFNSGGTLHTITNSITISGVTDPAPAAVYQSERYGTCTYTIPNLTASAQYKVRLHFAELFQTATGKRSFNVAINGTAVLSNFDIFAAVGAQFKAVIREFTATANSSGQIVITFTTVVDNATIGGIEVLTLNAAPTVSTSAAASPNPAAGTTATLAALGSDDGGESNLTYTWTTTGTPPAPVTFSANGTNAAKSSVATFTKAGTYSIRATITDVPGLSVTSDVTVTVNQTFTNLTVSPIAATAAINLPQQFTATGLDQFGIELTTQPTFSWTVSGGGIINTSGLFTAGATVGGPYTVTAASGEKSGTASVTVSLTPVAYAYPSACGAGQNMKVDGQINCSSLLIHNWLISQNGAATLPPDYVFENDYNLASLKEISAYIKQNGHLPEVPSAKELEKNGVDMIKLNFILLRKIEEMTLHMIRQEEKIEALEKSKK